MQGVAVATGFQHGELYCAMALQLGLLDALSLKALGTPRVA
jgi:hypothetical protein